MKNHGEIKVDDTYDITGRGLVLCVSMKSNDWDEQSIKVNDKVSYNGVLYLVRGIEAFRKGMT